LPISLGDGAPPAFRLSCLADVATMQDEPVVGMERETLRHLLLERQLHRQWRCPRREPGAIAYPEQMRVDRNGGLLEENVQHHIGRLAADAGQGLERLAHVGYLATVLFDQLLGERV